MARASYVYVVKYFGTVVGTFTVKKEAKTAIKKGMESKLRTTLGYTVDRYPDGQMVPSAQKEYGAIEDFLND